jgi:hypothetical protein
MKKNIEPCANCPAEIYQASDQVFYHLKTGNKFCVVGSGYFHRDLSRRQSREPKMRPTSTIGHIATCRGTDFEAQHGTGQKSGKQRFRAPMNFTARAACRKKKHRAD